MQILDIVKATFPHPVFDNPFADVSCEGSLSSRDTLACSWKDITTTYHSANGLNPHPDIILPLLNKVRVL